MKKTTAAFLVLCCLVSLMIPAFGAGNVQYVTGVREEMCRADYWTKKAKNADRVLMTASQINGYNKAATMAGNTNRVDLYAVPRNYDATALCASLLADIESCNPDRDLFLDGQPLDKNAFFRDISTAMQVTSLQGPQLFRYTICTAHTGIYSIPCDTFIGYSETDPDSEFQISELRVNEPFLVKQQCTFRGKTYFWGVSDHISGWIDAEHLADCGDRQIWKDAFAVQPEEKNFIVVTADSITTELSRSVPATSGVRLTIGTILKLVEPENIPQSIGERNAWNNYVVYLPTRAADGSYRQEIALLPQHSDVSVGFLPLTQKNILNQAFKCLGNRYGWGGTLGAMDCSMFNRAVYACCGINLPRNTNWQQNVPNTKTDLSGMTDAQKLAFLTDLPAGTMLYFPGHTMLYLGMENQMGYVISDTGTIIDPVGEPQPRSAYSVIINPLSARRKNGNTWLSELTAAVIPAEYNGHHYEAVKTKASPTKPGSITMTCAFCGAKSSSVPIASPKSMTLSYTTCSYNGKQKKPVVQIKDTNGKIVDATHYTVSYSNNIEIGQAEVQVVFHGDYEGSMTQHFQITLKGTAIKSVQIVKNGLIVTWKKLTKHVTGYQLQIARNAAFSKDSKTITIKDSNKSFYRISHLKHGTYYVRIRTIQKTNGKIRTSVWSGSTKIKLAKTK